MLVLDVEKAVKLDQITNTMKTETEMKQLLIQLADAAEKMAYALNVIDPTIWATIEEAKK